VVGGWGTRALTSEQSAGPWDRLAIHHQHYNCYKAVIDDLITQTADRSESRSGQTLASSTVPASHTGTRVQPHGRPRGLCGGRNGTATGSVPSISVSPVSYRNRDSSVGTASGYGKYYRGIGVQFPAGESRPGLRPVHPPIQWVPGFPCSGVKRTEHETGHFI
jgi:hypothetical protein